MHIIIIYYYFYYHLLYILCARHLVGHVRREARARLEPAAHQHRHLRKRYIYNILLYIILLLLLYIIYSLEPAAHQHRHLRARARVYVCVRARACARMRARKLPPQRPFRARAISDGQRRHCLAKADAERRADSREEGG